MPAPEALGRDIYDVPSHGTLPAFSRSFLIDECGELLGELTYLEAMQDPSDVRCWGELIASRTVISAWP